MRYRSQSINVIWVLIGSNILLFLATTVLPELRLRLGIIPLFVDVHPWTVITAMFIHAGFWHLFTNMLTLYFFGNFLLQLVETKWFLIIYFAGGVLGNLLFTWLGPPLALAVGASGAVFAIGGALVMLRPNVRVYLYFFIPLPLWVAVIGGFLILSFVPGIAWEAHLGGLIVGLIAGWFLRRRGKQRVRPGYYEWR